MQSPETTESEVQLRLPALETGLPVVRTFAAAVAAGWGFTLDVVEDVRLVASELLTMVMTARPGALTEVAMSRRGEALLVRVHTDELCPAPPHDSFGWLVVSEVSGSADSRSDATGLTLVAAMTPTGTGG